MRIPAIQGQSMRWLLAELVVVVLGILIAFQVDEWRTQKSDEELTSANLKAILIELDDEYSEFELVIPSLDSQLDSAYKLTYILESEIQDREIEVLEAYRGVFRNRQWRPNSATYTGLRESGRMYLVPEQTLIDQLFDYYEFGKYVGELMERLSDTRLRVRDTTLLDMWRTPTKFEPTNFITLELDYRLVSPYDQIPRDPKFYGVLGDHISAIASARLRIEDLGARNMSLQKAIQDYLTKK